MELFGLEGLWFRRRLGGGPGLDGAPQPPAALHPIAALGDGSGGVIGENAVLEAVGKNHPPPGPVVLSCQPPEVTEELGVGGARLFDLVDQPL